ncbi:MAG: ribose 5-phosphate isomerase B [Nanoarchaeota archaeon]|nr:ribose 5-phosphate isomerase B [Nanoarchaeota archaeon]MBU1103976.1 ribose 5-phosphate isomerase B [Nanoarchaeota archaeon]
MKEVDIFLASDHAGFKLKEKLKTYLQKLHQVEDLGPFSYNPKDDYPDFASKVARKVSKNKNSKGILVCSSGVGMAIAANKFRGIRAVTAYDAFTARFSREHNNTNILALRAKNFSFEKTKKIISIWLKTPFSNEERHKRRIRKIGKWTTLP